VLLLHVIDLRPLRYLGGLGFPGRIDPAAIARERRRLLDRLKARARKLERAGLRTTSRVLAGEPVRDLCRAANDFGAGVIVVASHGAGGLRRFMLGTTTQGLLGAAPCPVLTVKPLDWELHSP
jgi:nucleotide-binding universal stress UspA family protein